MEESILDITADIHRRLSRLMECERFGNPPKIMRTHAPKRVPIGSATKEQRAIALLYSQVIGARTRMHASDGMPFGVNPRMPFDHYRNHVMQPILYEMLAWSVHRAFPDKELDLYTLSFDPEWNMYAAPKKKRRRKKRGPAREPAS